MIPLPAAYTCCRCETGSPGGGEIVGADGPASAKDPTAELCVALPVLGFDREPIDLAEDCGDLDDELSEGLPTPTALVIYESNMSMPLHGEPLRVSRVHYLPNEQEMIPASISLYVNGFTVTLHPNSEGGLESSHSFAISPFTLVQACRLATPADDMALHAAQGSYVFKVSIFQHESVHMFGCTGSSAEPEASGECDGQLERARWVSDIARCIRVVTQSLFPPYSLHTEPTVGVRSTFTRIMATHLLHCGVGQVGLLFCEIRAHNDGAGTFVAYCNEACATEVMSIDITPKTPVGERVGVDCCCFSLCGETFATRTPQEKTMWLRAVTNIKVKVRCGTPNPTPSDLRHFRSAIREHAESIMPRSETPRRGWDEGPLLPQAEMSPPPTPDTKVRISGARMPTTAARGEALTARIAARSWARQGSRPEHREPPRPRPRHRPA